jgi:hypothetical protein
MGDWASSSTSELNPAQLEPAHDEDNRSGRTSDLYSLDL